MLDSRNWHDAGTTTPARRVPWWLIGLLLLAALVAAWWLTQPKRYHFVAKYSAYDRTLIPCTSGVLTREAMSTFVFRDWRGKERWRVHSAKPGPIIYDGEEKSFNFQVSPNGRVFAVAIASNSRRMRIQIWQDGRQTADLPLAIEATYGVSYPQVRALDDGRVFAWYRNVRTGRETIFMLIRQGRVIARGSAPLYNCLMAPDGSVIAGTNAAGEAYASVRVKADRILIASPRNIAGSLHIEPRPVFGGESALFADGYVMTRDGAVYDPKGHGTAVKGWEHSTIAPGGRYTLEQRGTQSRVFSPQSGMHWSFTIKGDNYGGDATPDGRYALAYFMPGEAPWMQTVQKIPWLNERVPAGTGQVIALYERPGRLRAVVPPTEIERWWNAGETWWYPGDGGHAVVMIRDKGNGWESVLLRY